MLVKDSTGKIKRRALLNFPHFPFNRDGERTEWRGEKSLGSSLAGIFPLRVAPYSGLAVGLLTGWPSCIIAKVGNLDILWAYDLSLI